MSNNRFKVHIKLQGLEMSIEGERDDIPLIRDAFGEQMRALLTPAATIVEGETSEGNDDIRSGPPLQKTSASTQRKKKTRSKATSTASTADEGSIIQFEYDTSQWGQPRLEWAGSQKAIWLMYVIQKSINKSDFTALEIKDTFNERFLNAGPFKKTSNIHRDLPKQTWQGRPVVGEHEGKFFLTQAADGYIENLITPTTH